MQVELFLYDRKKLYRVHQLVASVFVGPRPSPQHEVRHLDGNPENNLPGNLKWGTAQDNADDRESHGHTARGERQGHAKLTKKLVADIHKRLAAGELQRDIAKELGLCKGTISHIATGSNWAHVHA